MTEGEIASYEELARRLEEGARAIRNLLNEARDLKGLSLEASGPGCGPTGDRISPMAFDVRSNKAIRREKVETYAELANIDGHEMLQWKYFGMSSLHIVRSRLNDMGYKVKPPWGSFDQEG